MDKKQIAEKLRELRVLKQPDRLKFTQQSRFPKQVVEAIEDHDSVPSVTRLEKYLGALDTKLSTFFQQLEKEGNSDKTDPSQPILGFETFYADLGRIVLHADEATRDAVGKMLAAMADKCEARGTRVDVIHAQEKGNTASRERKKVSQGKRRA